jgi:hypothetical protein
LKQNQIAVLSVQRRPPPVGNIPDDGERDSGLARKVFAITPERRSPSTRNHVRTYPGIAFDFIPERRSASTGFPTKPAR